MGSNSSNDKSKDIKTEVSEIEEHSVNFQNVKIFAKQIKEQKQDISVTKVNQNFQEATKEVGVGEYDNPKYVKVVGQGSFKIAHLVTYEVNKIESERIIKEINEEKFNKINLFRDEHKLSKIDKSQLVLNDMFAQNTFRLMAMDFNKYCKAKGVNKSIEVCWTGLIDNKFKNVKGVIINGVEKIQYEPYLKGHFTKWMNNWDMFDHLDDIAHTFQHYSFLYSSLEYAVCDLQGVEGCYTDPQIVSWVGGFTIADLGQEAMEWFLARHKCNNYCRSLKLNWFGSNGICDVDTYIFMRHESYKVASPETLSKTEELMTKVSSGNPKGYKEMKNKIIKVNRKLMKLD